MSNPEYIDYRQEHARRIFYDWYKQKFGKKVPEGIISFINYLYAGDYHFTYNDIYNFSIGLYGFTRKNVAERLEWLTECGLLVKYKWAGETVYENAHFKPFHSHLVCFGCGKIYEYASKSHKQMIDEIENSLGISVDEPMFIKISCKKCKTKKTADVNNPPSTKS
jgi:Fe2+ or Zn2+ uptake regulation protein